MNTSRLDSIRDIVRGYCRQQSAHQGELSESILIRDGQYCGHRFTDGVTTAVWFVEEAEVKFYDCDGKIIQVVNLNAVGDSVAGRSSAAHAA